MKKLIVPVIALALAGLTGCDKSTPGGPGATAPNTGRIGQPENTFRLSVPTFEKTIKQGESRQVTIGITRETNFDQDVKLDFAGADGKLPAGVTITPPNPTIGKGDKEVSVTVNAAADAALGEHKIKVTGTPGTGAKATAEFQIEVKKPT